MILLGIFSMIILHQAFPHLHHQHHENDQHMHDHMELTHSDRHHHDNNGERSQEASALNFLGLLMDLHVHSTISSDITVIPRKPMQSHHCPVAKQVVAQNDIGSGSALPPIVQENPATYYPPPEFYFNQYLADLELRGPPSLG